MFSSFFKTIVYVYYNEGSFTISGGNVESITYKDAASFTVSGNPVISELNVTAGKLITLGDLTDGADITVIADGEFTVANTNAAAYLTADYIKGAGGREITESEGVLSMTVMALLNLERSIFGI